MIFDIYGNLSNNKLDLSNGNGEIEPTWTNNKGGWNHHEDLPTEILGHSGAPTENHGRPHFWNQWSPGPFLKQIHVTRGNDMEIYGNAGFTVDLTNTNDGTFNETIK